eukprot:GHVO01019700.1.p1 GENE.GHVO01019700.1~~GHVO01019700.1.p1  ORF type:complete len:415 (-),score=74.76 GHVO01019700.1:413-1522(-)
MIDPRMAGGSTDSPTDVPFGSPAFLRESTGLRFFGISRTRPEFGHNGFPQRLRTHVKDFEIESSEACRRTVEAIITAIPSLCGDQWTAVTEFANIFFVHSDDMGHLHAARARIFLKDNRVPDAVGGLLSILAHPGRSEKPVVYKDAKDWKCEMWDVACGLYECDDWNVPHNGRLGMACVALANTRSIEVTEYILKKLEDTFWRHIGTNIDIPETDPEQHACNVLDAYSVSMSRMADLRYDSVEKKESRWGLHAVTDTAFHAAGSAFARVQKLTGRTAAAVPAVLEAMRFGDAPVDDAPSLCMLPYTRDAGALLDPSDTGFFDDTTTKWGGPTDAVFWGGVVEPSRRPKQPPPRPYHPLSVHTYRHPIQT